MSDISNDAVGFTADKNFVLVGDSRREFEQFGSIKSIHLVQDSNTGKPRGYAFIEYEHERDMHSAYKHADGMKIDGKSKVVNFDYR